MPVTSPSQPKRGERRRCRRVAQNRNVRLVAREVDGFVLDISRTGARIALFATGALAGGTVLLSVEGAHEPRLAVVQWVRAFVDGSVVGVEFLEELGEIGGEVTQIRAVPVRAIEDVPGAARTMEEGSVVVLSCVRLVA